MKSRTVPSFWKCYRKMPANVRTAGKKAFRLWRRSPFHPSLHFKCIDTDENIWSVRVTIGYRAISVMDDDAVTWFWIGNHDDYERFFG